MKKLFCILTFLCVMAIISLQVFALQGNFTFSVGTTEKVVKPGEELEIDLKVSDITSEKDGINSIQGDLSYSGEDVVENIEIVGKTNWSTQINKEENSNLKGRFVLSNLNGITTDQTIGNLKIKVKQDAKAGDIGYIYLKNVHSSYANNNGVTEEDKTNSYDVTIKLTIENSSENTPQEPDKQEPENPPADTTPEQDKNEPEKPSTDTTPEQDKNEQQKPSTDKKPEQDKNEQQKPSTNKTPEKDNTIADKPLSQTGVESVLVPIIILSIMAVVSFIKYKKII